MNLHKFHLQDLINISNDKWKEIANILVDFIGTEYIEEARFYNLRAQDDDLIIVIFVNTNLGTVYPEIKAEELFKIIYKGKQSMLNTIVNDLRSDLFEFYDGKNMFEMYDIFAEANQNLYQHYDEITTDDFITYSKILSDIMTQFVINTRKLN